MTSDEIQREGMLSDMETLRAEKRELRAEIERLQASALSAWEERDQYLEQNVKLKTEIERLTAAIQRIDGINDNPAHYNPGIEAVIRRLEQGIAENNTGLPSSKKRGFQSNGDKNQHDDQRGADE